MVRIFPSLMSSNLLCIKESIETLSPYCAGFHIDVMDNHFVPNMTFGPAMVNAIDAASSHPSWVHLMVDNPADWCSTLILKRGSIISFHIESSHEPKSIIHCIKEKGRIPSVAVSPKTNVAILFPLLDIIDHILIMSVNPGFSGQLFLESAIPKIAAIAQRAQSIKKQITIGIDGGINEKNIERVIAAGARDIALASAIFDTQDPLKALQTIKESASCAKKSTEY